MIISTRKIDENDYGTGFEVTAAPPGEDLMDMSSSSLKEMKSELFSIKEMIRLLDHSGGMTEKLAMNPDIFSLYAKLIKNGVSSAYARIFFEKTGAFSEIQAKDFRKVRGETIKEIMKAIKVNTNARIIKTPKTIASVVPEPNVSIKKKSHTPIDDAPQVHIPIGPKPAHGTISAIPQYTIVNIPNIFIIIFIILLSISFPP